MAEFIECEDESFERENIVSSSQVTKRPHIRSTSTFPLDPVRSGSNAFLYHSEYNAIHMAYRHQHLYDEPRRPGTPALIVDDAPSRLYGHPDESIYDDSGGERYMDGPYGGGVSREPSLIYPPTAAPPTSPSQLYQLLIQRNIRPSTKHRDPYIVNTEWTSNIFQSRDMPRNESHRDFRERDGTYGRLFNNTRPRLDHYEQTERRPFLNQNYTRLPFNMVRIKNSNEEDKQSNGMNGFTADGEGNHECHDLRHGSVPVLDGPPASMDDFHHIGSLQMGAEAQETNGMSFGNIYQGEWPMHRALWMSGPSCIGEKDPLDGFGGDDTESIMSFSSTTATMSGRRPHGHQLGTKVEMVYSLLSMLGSCNKEDMSRTLLEMSSNQDSCIAMRQSGCLPLLIQLLHGNDGDQVLSEQSSSQNIKWAVREARRRASQALHNIVHAHPDDRRGRREARVLRLLEQIRDYSDFLRDIDSSNVDFSHNENLDLHPGPAIAALMKLSFDEEHRHAMCQLGGLQAIAELIQADHEVHGNTSDQFCVTVRRYAGMALTNLTFGDGNNKALLCSMKPFMQALVAQLHSPNEDLRQVTASVLRNLSWRADASSKQILREVGVVTTLMTAAVQAQKESTLKSILSALWNLSAHCSMNKADICEVEGALEFLVSTLTYKSTSNTLSIVENGGGILRNISSHIAVREDYRAVLRKHKCLQTLLAHLKSPSLTIVSNACGTLWNLSARCAEDQQALWEMGAVGMLRNLIHSKHKMISMGSSAALKNLLAARPDGIGTSLTSSHSSESGHHMNGSFSNMPSLLVRKQRALAADLDENLAETCDNIDSPKTSPTPNGDFSKKFSYETNGLDRKPQFLSYLPGRMYHSINGHVGSPVRVPRSESKDSLGSTRSEPPHYKAQRERFKIFINNNRSPALDSRIVQEKPTEWKEKVNLPFEGNSNVVLQMFRHLQGGNTSNTMQDVKTNGHPELSDEEKPAVRPNSLPGPRRGNSNIRNNRLLHRNAIQHLHQTKAHHDFDHTNGYAYDTINLDQKLNVDLTGLLEIPGNKRSVLNGKQDFMSTREGMHNGLFRQENGAEFNEPVVRPNVVMRRKRLDTMSSSATTLSKDMSEDASVDQTPLVVSRCSSLSSLTSCFQHSARSSWLSDVSQRTSAVISPSDLPDSPGCNITEDKHHVYEFTDKILDADAHSLIRPRPAWPLGSLNSNDSLPSSVKRMSLESDVFVNSNEPLNHTDQSENTDILETPDSTNTTPTRLQNSPMSPVKDRYSSSESSSSQENQEPSQNRQEKDMIAACISLGMPNNFSQKQIVSESLSSKVNSLLSSYTSSRSGIPVKSRLAQSFPIPSSSKVLLTPTDQQSSLPGSALASSTQTITNSQNLERSICDDNDNLLVNSGNANAGSSRQEEKSVVSTEQSNSDHNKAVSQAFLSKCLSVCKKYPALSQKSSFDLTSGKIKTSIPQIIRTENPRSEVEQPPIRQYSVKSQSLPVYRGTPASKSTNNSRPAAAQGNSSSTEENVSEDNILSSSPSACDESEGQESEDRVHGEVLLRNNRVRSRKTKANRRSMEIRPPSEHSSEDDNKNMFSRAVDLCLPPSIPHISVPSSESEEKVKEDARTREKVSRGVIPDLLEGAAFSDGLSQETEGRALSGCKVKTSVPRNMTDSMELRRGALQIASELEEGLEECTNSSASFDLENMKPPSCMGEMSMTSSGLSDLLSNGNGCYINGKRAVDRRRNMKRSKKISNSHRFVFKSVRQNYAKNLDVSRQCDKPVSASTSMENVSMKSSGTSDLLENMNPPSIFDDLSMTNSCASLNSISSDILESRSQSMADPRSNSEMFQRLNAAAAMVQVYSRELSNIMTGSMKSSCNSECLDLVKPPSIFQEIAEVTVEDRTDGLSDPLVSDFELEEELPHDDEPSIPTETVHHSPFPKHLDGSAEHLNSSVDGDSLMDREHFQPKRIRDLVMDQPSTPNSIQNPTDDDMSSGFYSNLTTEDHCSIDRDDNLDNLQSPSPPTIRRGGPRIVKPINRETVRQLQEKKIAEKSVKVIRGRASVSASKNLLQKVTSAKIMSAKSGFAKTPSPAVVSGVRPTRTSALRASQNKQGSSKPNDRMSPRSFLSKPPVVRVSSNKPVPQKTNSFSSSEPKVSNSKSEVKRPSPPTKQNTFTKDETPKVPLATVSGQPTEEKKINGKGTSPEAKFADRKLSFNIPGLPSSSTSLQRKLSAPPQRRSTEKGIPLSPGSQGIAEDGGMKKLPEKKSPSTGNIAGRVPTVGSRTTSTNSLSSLSSNSLSVKKQNSQKDVPSKISSIWKKSESSSSSNSPVTDSSGDKPQLNGTRSKTNAAKSAAMRSSSVTTSKGIPRSSTYEKLSKPPVPVNSSTKPQLKSTPKTSARPRQPLASRPTKKPPSAPAKPAGGARIVKPVTKPNAITSRTLRQSSSFCPYPETRSYSLSSGPPSYISCGKSYGGSEDQKTSIPLVTAPFAYATPDASYSSKADHGDQRTEESQIHNLQFLKSDSGESDNEKD